MQRQITALCIVSVLLAVVFMCFWQQELKYLRPTPLPDEYKAVAVKEAIRLQDLGISQSNKPMLLHFFNPNCPCSRFALPAFVSLVQQYSKAVDFRVVLQYSTDTLTVRGMLGQQGVELPIIIDTQEALAKRCGVYSTPQAVILQNDATLFYRGNYNRSRYCTDPQTSYAQLALAALVKGENPPQFAQLATTAYGCELAPDKSSFLRFLSL